MPDAAPAATTSAPSAAPSSPSSSPGATTSTPSAAPAPSPAPSASPAAPAPAAAAEPTPKPRAYRYKSGDIEAEIEAEMLDGLAQRMGLSPDEILKGAQMSRNAYQRWQEAAKLRKEAEELQAQSKKRYEDPRVTQIKQQNPGMDDEDAYALARVLALKEREEMSPEARMLADERQRREALEKQIREKDEQGKKAELEAQTKAEAAKIERGLIEAVQKVGLGKSTAAARAVLEHMATMARAGEVADPEAAALFVRRQMQANDVERLGAMTDEQIETWLGKPIIDRILKRSVDKLRQPGAPAQPATPPPPAPHQEEGRKMLSEEEWRAKYR